MNSKTPPTLAQILVDAEGYARIAFSGETFPHGMTYAVDGVQYVAVITGGTAATEMFWAPLTPEIQTTTLGTTLWVFRVPRP